MKRLLSVCAVTLLCLALQLFRALPAAAEGWLPALDGELPVISIVTDDLAYATEPTRETKQQGGSPMWMRPYLSAAATRMT